MIENINFVIKEHFDDYEKFINQHSFKNSKSKQYYFHGTSKTPNNFELRDDYDFEDSHDWSGELPYGYIFLTTDLNEAKSYGKYVIPFELKRHDKLIFRVYNDNPSRAFDMDYGIDLFKPDVQVNFWEKFEDSMKSVLVIKGNRKSTIITGIDNVIPRIDIAKKYYK